MTWKSYVVVSGAGVLATYLATPPLMPDRRAIPASAADANASSGTEAPDIVREAARLESRLRAEAAFRAPARNPFEFGEAPAPARRPRERAPLDADAVPRPAAPEPPFIVLSGIATDVLDGLTVRTAVLTTASGVSLVREGDLVGTEYRVRVVREDGVDLESTADGSIRALRFPAP
jgi:hypothetical protein